MSSSAYRRLDDFRSGESKALLEVHLRRELGAVEVGHGPREHARRDALASRAATGQPERMHERAIEALADANREVAAELTARLVARNLIAAQGLIDRISGRCGAIVVEIVENARVAEAAPVWRIETPKRSRIRFHPATWARYPTLILGRFVATLPMLLAALPALSKGWCSLNLGDEGHRPGLAFCDYRQDFALVPDAIFLMTGGYAELSRSFGANRSWVDRAPVLFWRGALTGRRPQQTVESLPRVRLCRWADAAGLPADIGLTDLLSALPAEQGALAGLQRPYVATTQFDRYRLHIDIDGYTNSWPGLMSKLLSGSPILKVVSEGGWRQWYYDRLVPWTHYVPVRADLTDLAVHAARLLADDDLAQEIGAAGRSLARSITIGGEIARAIPIIAAAIRT